LNLEKLKPEEKVNLAINMTDVVVQICAEGVRSQEKIVNEKELIEKVRARMMIQKRRHHEV